MTKEFGKGFSQRNIEQMRSFYIAFSHKYVPLPIPQTVSAELPNSLKPKTVSADLTINKKNNIKTQKSLSELFPHSWSHYIILSRIENDNEKSFYEIDLPKPL